MKANRLDIPIAAMEAFCRKWRVAELAVFGSAARGDSGPESDVDMLVTFQTGEQWDLWDIVIMKEELESLVGRPVDLVEEKALRNPFLRAEIAARHEVIQNNICKQPRSRRTHSASPLVCFSLMS